MTALNPVATIGDQVAEGLLLHLDLTPAEARDRADHLLERVGLPASRFPPGLYPHQLSGGQRQRVVIAMALACKPALLIADEPTTALDVTIQAQILDLIVEIAAEEGMALMMITHDLGVVAETCAEMLVMYAGRIVERGPTEAVFADLAHPYSRGLFAALPLGHDHEGASTEDLRAAARPRLSTIPGQVPSALLARPGCAFAGRCALADATCHDQPPPVATLSGGHQAVCFHPRRPEGADRV